MLRCFIPNFFAFLFVRFLSGLSQVFLQIWLGKLFAINQVSITKKSLTKPKCQFIQIIKDKILLIQANPNHGRIGSIISHLSFPLLYILIPMLFFVVMLLKSPFMYIVDGEGVLDSAQSFPHVRFHIFVRIQLYPCFFSLP